MAKFAVILFVAFAFQAVLAAPATQDGEKTHLEQLATQIQTATSDITTTLQKNLPDTKTISEAITTHTGEFTHGVESILKKLQTEIDNNKGKRDDLLKEISGKVSESLASIHQLTGPDATKKINEVRTELENNVKNIAGEFEKLGKNIQPNLEQAGDNIGTFAQGVLGDFLKTVETFKTQVKDAVDKKN